MHNISKMFELNLIKILLESHFKKNNSKSIQTK